MVMTRDDYTDLILSRPPAHSHSDVWTIDEMLRSNVVASYSSFGVPNGPLKVIPDIWHSANKNIFRLSDIGYYLTVWSGANNQLLKVKLGNSTFTTTPNRLLQLTKLQSPYYLDFSRGFITNISFLEEVYHSLLILGNKNLDTFINNIA